MMETIDEEEEIEQENLEVKEWIEEDEYKIRSYMANMDNKKQPNI